MIEYLVQPGRSVVVDLLVLRYANQRPGATRRRRQRTPYSWAEAICTTVDPCTTMGR